MKFVAVLILAACGSRAAAQETGHRSEITVGGVPWTLEASVRPVTVRNGWAGELVRFTVRRDGVFAHSLDAVDGGRLVGRRMFHGHEGGFRVEPFPAAAPSGWLLTTASHYGNTFGLRYAIVAPHDDGRPDPRPPHYRQLIAESARDPVVRITKEGIEVWGAYQDWGNGGTSSSTYVPFRHVVARDGAIRRRPLPADVAAWPLEELRDRVPVGFPGIFLAGLRERNPAVMRWALTELFPKPDGPPWCRGFGLPDTRPELEAMVDAVESLARTERQLRDRVPNLNLDDPVPAERR